MGKRSTPSDSSNSGIRVVFAELGKDETPPEIALYSIGDDGKPAAKLAQAKQGTLQISPQRLKGRVAIGPDVQDLNELTADRLVSYRADQVAKVWAGGLTLPRARWTVFWPPFYCVSGRVRKCRPWWWDIIDITPVSASLGSKLSKAVAIKVQASSQIALSSQANAFRYVPWRCVPLCDGIIEIYERQCCCIRVVLPDLIDRLREILQQIPIPWPPIPDPDPWPEPGPGPDPAPFMRRAQEPRMAKAAAGTIARGPDPSFAPPDRLYEAYVDLQRLPALEAERYALERPWLYPFFCNCSSRKVGEVPIQPGGYFDFCYRRGLVPFRCYLTYAYRIRQLIGGVWTVVYDGVASGAWFAAGEEADIRVTNPRALPCGDPSGDPPPNEGNPFVMLEHVTGAGTHHFNFPAQTSVSQLAAPDADDGLYTTGYAPDCPWGDKLGLRLWFSPELRGTVAFYRISVVPVDSTGAPSGARVPLDDGVNWSKFVFNGTDWVVQGDSLGPSVQGGESSLFRVPYWADGNWLSGQYHQVWNTNPTAFPNGRYMLILEVFDAAGARIKPNGAAGPGAGKPFEFRRWSSDTVTANVPFADCAHLFWIDNLKVFGDIEDLRQNGVRNSDECQFMSGTPNDQFSIGYRAYHVNGISNTDSFMYWHTITWQRGLNGATGNLAPEVSPTTDAGEGGAAAQSGSASFGTMLGINKRCSFSVTLSVYAKHWNGGTRISAYDYYETASFALDQGP
jgi:hypothetical protein